MNRYEVLFDGEKLGDTYSMKKAVHIALDIIKIIVENPIGEDDYKLLQIHCYWWFDRIFFPSRYSTILFDIKENKFTVKNTN